MSKVEVILTIDWTDYKHRFSLEEENKIHEDYLSASGYSKELFMEFVENAKKVFDKKHAELNYLEYDFYFNFSVYVENVSLTMTTVKEFDKVEEVISAYEHIIPMLERI